MKKVYLKTLKLLLIISMSFFIFNISYAECTIKDGPPDILQKHFENIRKVITNIANEASSKYTPQNDKGFKYDFKKSTSELGGLWNSISNWGFYNSTFEFYIAYPISNEMPNEIMRDNELIEKEIGKIKDFSKQIVMKGYGNIKIDNACAGVPNCELSGDVKDILGELIKSIADLGELFRLSILDKKYLFSGDIILVDKNFKEKFSLYYNQNTTTLCSDSEGGFFFKIKKSFNKIVSSFKSGKNGMAEWEDAIGLLNENSDFSGNKADEMRLLKEELTREGVSLDNTTAIMKNLKEYHDGGGYSWGNNLLTNSYNSVKRVGEKVYNVGKRQYSEFTKVYNQWDAARSKAGYKSKQGGIKKISVRENKNITDRIQRTNEIGKEILTIYNSEKGFASIQDITNTSIKGRIVNIHFQITQAISTLTKTCPIAEKVCNKQVTGRGKCSCK